MAESTTMPTQQNEPDAAKTPNPHGPTGPAVRPAGDGANARSAQRAASRLPMTPALMPLAPRWQPDRRNANRRPARPAHERRSGADKRRQPRLSGVPRPIYHDH